MFPSSPERWPPQPAQLPGERSVQTGPVEGAEHGGAEDVLLLHPAALRLLEVFGLLPLSLVSPVLEPDLHLGLGESQACGQVSPLRG